jgi:hypothetical protein
VIRDVARADRLSFNITTHAIGDRGADAVLNADDAVGVRRGDRWQLEHVQVMGDDLIERMAAKGVIGSSSASPRAISTSPRARSVRSALRPRTHRRRCCTAACASRAAATSRSRCSRRCGACSGSLRGPNSTGRRREVGSPSKRRSDPQTPKGPVLGMLAWAIPRT